MYDKEFMHIDEDTTCITKGGKLNENIIDDSVDVDDINMSSFKIKDGLNGLIWGSTGIRPKVRIRLLQIAQDFWDEVEIKWVDPIDVIVTGSIANYNWSRFSDIDLHLIVDFSQIGERADLVKELMDAKKNIWNSKHDELKINGFNVELYVQDINETVDATGIYSLYRNKWLRKPSRSVFLSKKVDDDDVRRMAAHFINDIDDLSEDLNDAVSALDIEDVSKRIYLLYDKIRQMRKSYLQKEGEFSLGDKVYKVLRRAGYLEKLIDLKSKSYDKVMSI